MQETTATKRNIGRTFVGIGILAVAVLWALYSAPIPFIPMLWRSTSVPEAFHMRHRLADGLVESKRLVGLSASEVETLLGPSLSDGSPISRDRMVYALGSQRSYMPIDYEVLEIYLDVSEIVTKAAVEVH